MESITVGIDSESASLRAVDWVIRRARSAPVDVKLVTAFDSLIDDPIVARDRQLRIADSIRAAHPECQVEIQVADTSIHRALVERAASSDLLVVGAHRTRPLRSLLAGEFSAHIAAQSPCPTVIVPDDWTPRDGDIVVGLSDDDSSDSAMIFGAREAARSSATIHLVHAWRATGGPQQTIHRAVLGDAGRRLLAGFPDAELVEELVQDRTPSALIEQSGSAELIVIGTHHREPLVGRLLGSTSSLLLRQSRVPVCIVPDMGSRLDGRLLGRDERRTGDGSRGSTTILDPRVAASS